MNWDKLLGTIVFLSLLPLILTVAAIVLIVGGVLSIVVFLLAEHGRLIEHWYHKLNCDELPGQPNWWEQ